MASTAEPDSPGAPDPLVPGRPGKALPLAEARARVLAETPRLPAERVPLAALTGRRLAEAITARSLQPPADLSAMDGYAVRVDDLAAATAAAPVVLQVVGSSRAGGPEAPSPGPGEAVRIATGARVPAGAEAVVVQESCTPGAEGQLAVRTAARPGDHIRRAGEEYRPGDRLLPPGTLGTPAVLGLLASDGWDEVLVYRRPRVAILSLGDELQSPGEPRHDANGPMLQAACEEAGAEVVARGLCGDRPEEAVAWLAAQVESCDVLLSSGSASVGDYDVMGEAWRRLGVVERFNRVAIRPGKPCHFGRLDDRLLAFALPGNPLAALTGFEELVAPALERLAGGEWQPAPRLRLPLASPLRLKREARYLVRLPAGEAVEPPARQGSAPLRLAATAGRSGDWDGPCHRPAGWPVEVRATPESLRGGLFRPAMPLPPVLGVRGFSGSGKTRLVEQLVPALIAQGLRVGTVKHSHHVLAPGPAGKDSTRHAEAGAALVLAVGADTAVLTRRLTDEVPPADWLEPFAGQVDLVLLEGFKALPVEHVAITVGDDFALSRGHEEGLVVWRLTRPAGDSLTWPEPLLAELLDDLTGWLADR